MPTTLPRYVKWSTSYIASTPSMTEAVLFEFTLRILLFPLWIFSPSRDVPTQSQRLQTMFERLRGANLKLRPPKVPAFAKEGQVPLIHSEWRRRRKRPTQGHYCCHLAYTADRSSGPCIRRLVSVLQTICLSTTGTNYERRPK